MVVAPDWAEVEAEAKVDAVKIDSAEREATADESNEPKLNVTMVKCCTTKV